MPDGKPVPTLLASLPKRQRAGLGQGPGAGAALVGQVGCAPGMVCVPPALWLTGWLVARGACSTCCCGCCCCCGWGLRGAAGADAVFFGFGLTGFAATTGGGSSGGG